VNKKEKIKGLFREKELKETKHYSKKVAITVLIAVAVLLVALTIIGVMFIQYEFKDTDSFSKLVEENPDGYLLKPPSKEKMIAAIRKTLEKQNEPTVVVER